MKPTKTHRLEIGAPERVTLILVGCGGTGSYAALHLAQFAYAARDHGVRVRLAFVDPDTVEAKNVARQNFAPPEIGQPKAVTLAQRYSLAMGLAIAPVVGKFDSEVLSNYKERLRFDEDSLTVIVGCVDNAEARQAIRAAILLPEGPAAWQKDLFWLDAGNHYAHGQVLLGNSTHPRPLLSPLGFAYGLPLPSVQVPALLSDEAALDAAEPLSCAELVERDIQARTINKMMAAWIDVFVERLVIARDLRIMGVELDQRIGRTAGIPIAGGEVIEDKPQQSSYPVGYPAHDEEDAEAAELTCPECGVDLVAGRDVIDDQEVDIYFCVMCNWRMPAEEFDEIRAGEAVGRLMG